MAVKIISVIISGVDKLSSVVGQSNKSLDTLQTRVNKLGTGMALGGAGLLAGGLGAANALGLTALPGQLVKAERNLISLGNVGELTASQLKPIGKEIFGLQKITNQAQGNLFEGINTLVASGLDPQIAVKFLKPIGQAATAEDADIKELAQTTFTVYDNLKVPVTKLGDALNIMTLAGKRGRFELKNMAQEFPTLTAGANLLGLSVQKSLTDQNGKELMGGGLRTVSQISAALQVAMKGAGTPGQAATNMGDFYGKLFSNRVMESMKKITGDPMKLVKVWGAALKAGEDPMEKTMMYLDKLTNFKDPAYRSAAISKIFQDREVQNFVKVMMPNLKKYTELRDEWMKSSPESQNVIGGDYARIVASTAEQFKLLQLNAASIVAPNLEGPLTTANSLLQLFNNHAILTKGLLFGIGGAIVAGGTLVGLGTMAFSLSSIIALFSSTLTTAMLLKGAFGLLLPAITVVGSAIGIVSAGLLGLKIGDVLGKQLFGYKVGLGDIIDHGGYDKAVEANRQDEMRATLHKLYPNKTEEQIDALVNAHAVDTENHNPAKPYDGGYGGGWGMMAPAYGGMGAYYSAQGQQNKMEGELKITLPNAPPGAKVTIEKQKNMKLDADLGSYR